MRPPGVREKLWAWLVVGPSQSCDPEDVSASVAEHELLSVFRVGMAPGPPEGATLTQASAAPPLPSRSHPSPRPALPLEFIANYLSSKKRCALLPLRCLSLVWLELRATLLDAAPRGFPDGSAAFGP